MTGDIVIDESNTWFNLRKKENELRDHRISRALQGDTGIRSSDQKEIASWLYEIKYENHNYDTNIFPTKEEILENFCSKVFGCSFDEVMIAYDRFLG